MQQRSWARIKTNNELDFEDKSDKKHHINTREVEKKHEEIKIENGAVVNKENVASCHANENKKSA